jgi:hypothetical protein
MEVLDSASHVVNLAHHNRYLESFDRNTRLDLLKKVAVVRTYRTNIARPDRGRENFLAALRKHRRLGSVRALPDLDRRQLWGPAINPLDALADFDPKLIHDGHLGGP